MEAHDGRFSRGVRQGRDSGIGRRRNGGLELESTLRLQNALTHLIGQGLQQLIAGTVGGRLYSELREPVLGHPQKHAEGFGLVCIEADQSRPIVEPQFNTPVVATMRDDGQAGFRQGIEIPEDGTPGYFELTRQLQGGNAAPVLQYQQYSQQPRGAHNFDPNMTLDGILPKTIITA